MASLTGRQASAFLSKCSPLAHVSRAAFPFTQKMYLEQLRTWGRNFVPTAGHPAEGFSSISSSAGLMKGLLFRDAAVLEVDVCKLGELGN